MTGINHLVPVFIPADTIEAMKLLTNEKIRKDSGINLQNMYVFASGQGSQKHFPGWHSLANVCDKVPISDRSCLNGTSNRHRLSTILAGLNLTDLERDLVFKHFGHSKEMNEHIYQAPAAHLQLSTTGKFLSQVDKGCY